MKRPCQVGLSGSGAVRARRLQRMRGEPDMWLFGPKRPRRPSRRSIWMFMAGLIGTCVGSVAAPTVSCAQQLLPADREEIADQERLSWTLSKFPPQPYMNEVYW